MGKEKLQLDHNIRSMTESDLEAVARVHKKSWREDHFSSRLNISLLTKYYGYILSFNEYCFVAESDKKIIGFAVAGSRTRMAVKAFIKAYFIEMTWVTLYNPEFWLSRLKNAIKIFTSKNITNSRAKIRLLSIAVDPQFEGHGVGVSLMNTLENVVQKDNHRYFGLSVNKDNQRAIQLYNNRGWVIESNESSGIYYIKEFKAQQ